ncbi:cupin [Thalassospira profundimaris]|uniref:Cupin n=1 Tax=Thalassospira profundimaris TaxID=502049 RepID=A0A367WFE3_9PROT|nr:cupin domain-containing protein [Thalassospira profundimaris]RCK40176.1 cupin [Thalassospira profundimaris]
MSVIEKIEKTSLEQELRAHVGRHVDKVFDWDAFPSNKGYPELARAQMRYIGAGGSPKVNDNSTLKPDNFTLSLIYKEVGKYAACHSHEIEESFLMIDGVLTVGWELNGDVVEVRLGPKDMILNAREIGHGFRNDGVEPVLMSVSVDVGKPLPPKYHFHPKDTEAELARNLGAAPGKAQLFDPKNPQELHQIMSKYVVRYNETPTIWTNTGFSRKVYVGAEGIVEGACRKEMLGVPSGVGVKGYVRDCEDAFFVLEGNLTVGWEENGEVCEVELGPRDLVKNPAGRKHWFRNNGAKSVEVWHLVGSAKAENIEFVAD